MVATILEKLMKLDFLMEMVNLPQLKVVSTRVNSKMASSMAMVQSMMLMELSIRAN